MPLLTRNPYLEGNYAPVRDERDDTHLVVEGTIPSELDGTLLRNGANPILDPDPSMYHWFFGDGMVHSIELLNGDAHYRNRWVRTPAACAALGEPTPAWVPEVNGIGSVANTSIVRHAGRILATVETSVPTEIGQDLSTIGAFDFAGALTSSFTAHPLTDSVTGEMLFFGYDPLGPPYLRYHVADASGRLAQTSVIDIPRPVMMHTFASTATRVLWFDLPVVFDLELFGARPMPFAWRPEHGARVGVMSRSGDTGVTWIDIELCYLYHHINAYDDGTSIVVDVVRYPDNYATDRYGIGASSSSVSSDGRSTRSAGASTCARSTTLPRSSPASTMRSRCNATGTATPPRRPSARLRSRSKLVSASMTFDKTPSSATTSDPGEPRENPSSLRRPTTARRTPGGSCASCTMKRAAPVPSRSWMPPDSRRHLSPRFTSPGGSPTSSTAPGSGDRHLKEPGK